MTFAACTLAEITGIRLKVNGALLQQYATGTELNNFNLLDKLATAGTGDFTNPLIMNFDTVGLRTRDLEELTALGTHRGNLDEATPIISIQLELDIASGATGATVDIKAEQSGPAVAGIVKKIKQFTYSPAATGIFQMRDIPRVELLRRVMFNSAQFSSLRIEADNFTLFKRTAAENAFIIAASGWRANVANKFIVDTAENGFGSDALVLPQYNSLLLEAVLSGTTQFTGVYEFVGPIDR
jgi:hypothetical protein